jgi:hypothetical protein
MTRARFGHTATRLLDGRVVVVGGTEAFGQPFPTEVEIYNPTSHAWSLAAPIPMARMFHAAVLLRDGRVLVAGGDAPGPGDTATAYIYDAAANTWTSAGSMSVAREPGRFGAATLPNGDVLVAGGYDITTGGAFPAADRYNVATGTWTTLPDLAEARNGNTVTALRGGRVLVAGGKNGGQIHASTEIFDPTTGQWTAGPSLQTARWAHTVVAVGDGQFLAIGGRTPSGDTETVERYEPQSNTWMSGPSMQNKRFKGGSTVIDSATWVNGVFVKARRVFAIGGASGTVSTNTVEELVIPTTMWSVEEQ